MKGRIGLYVPGDSLASFPESVPQPQCKSSGPRQSALETLDEVSHNNALHLLDEDQQPSSLPPTQRALAFARSRGYSFVVTDLSTPAWKKRWAKMCLEVTESSTFESDGGGGMIPSSSRASVPPVINTSEASSFFGPAVRQAEEWRANPSFRQSEVNLTTCEATPGVTLQLSQWIELDATDEGVRLDAELALTQEVSFAAHINASAVVLPAPASEPERRRYSPHYARVIASCLATTSVDTTPLAGNTMDIIVRLPITSPYEMAQRFSQGLGSPNGHASPCLGSGKLPPSTRPDGDWAWETWSTIQDVCEHNPRVKIMLDLGVPMPGQPLALGRWASEPIYAIWIPARSFLTNRKGYPVLSKTTQSLLRALIHQNPRIILSNTEDQPAQHPRGGSGAYLQYINQFVRKNAETSTEVDRRLDHADNLRAPLQPLLDNLLSSTYAELERDTAKYNLYEEAITAALIDTLASGPQRLIRICVCGAGRGALVSRCLRAAARSRAQAYVIALEKNQQSIVVLQERQEMEWGAHRVMVRYGDMRFVCPPSSDLKKADIVVSDLLGSWGDNQLSPECLDGATRLLKPNGICIPSSYCNFATPITSPILHAEAIAADTIPPLSDDQKRKALETPYVAQLQQVGFPAISGGRGGWPAVQPVWAFQHGPIDTLSPGYDQSGLPLTNAHNVRTSALTFYIPQAAVLHGLAGYFEARLYGDVTLSTLPDPVRGSPGIKSWSKLFLPFTEPLYVPPGSELDVHLWRMAAPRRIWYEWYAESFLPVPTAYIAPTVETQTTPEHQSLSRQWTPTAERRQQADKEGSYSPSIFSNVPTPMVLSRCNTPTANGSAVGLNLYSRMANSASGGRTVSDHREHQRTWSNSSGSTSRSATSSTTITRIKTNMTALMNSGGRSSWLSH